MPDSPVTQGFHAANRWLNQIRSEKDSAIPFDSIVNCVAAATLPDNYLGDKMVDGIASPENEAVAIRLIYR
jgi:hypothetical protein